MQIRQIFQVFLQMSAQTAAAPAAHPVRICCGSCCCLTSYGRINSFRAIPHNSKCRYGERGAADVKPKAQIILDAAKVSAASGGNSEPKQGQRSQSARGFCPRSTMRVPQPDIIEHFGNADAVPQPPERCLSRKAGIVRCCPYACAWLNPAQNSAPNVAAMTALMVCIRFSASWNTMDCGPVNTSSVTSMALRPNFSPISLPTAVLWS